MKLVLTDGYVRARKRAHNGFYEIGALTSK